MRKDLEYRSVLKIDIGNYNLITYMQDRLEYDARRYAINLIRVTTKVDGIQKCHLIKE